MKKEILYYRNKFQSSKDFEAYLHKLSVQYILSIDPNDKKNFEIKRIYKIFGTIDFDNLKNIIYKKS